MEEKIASCFLLDILSRLDVCSLIRFKCVSKSWFNLICSPSFQDLHHQRSQRNLRFLFRSSSSYYNQHEQPNRRFIYHFLSVDILGKVHNKFTAKVDDPIKLVLPSCCGLVCFATNTLIYLCNPATRQIAALPAYPYDQSSSSIAGFGFGYVGSIKGYKVVRLIHRVIGPSMTHKIECSVFTIVGLGLGGNDNGNGNGNGWRVLDDGCPYFVEQFSYPVFIKESINWKINRRRHRVLKKSNDYIVSFNVREEKFFTITHPADWRNIAQNSTQLADLGGMLCMVEISTSQIVLWVLGDHQNCLWHKRGLIDLSGIDRRVVGEVKCFNNGEIIFSSFANILLFYEMKKKRFRQVVLPFRAFEFGIYWESFLSLGNAH